MDNWRKDIFRLLIKHLQLKDSFIIQTKQLQKNSHHGFLNFLEILSQLMERFGLNYLWGNKNIV